MASRYSRWYHSVERWPDADVASAARTATATGTAFNTEDAIAVLATLQITVVSGTNPTLDVRLETTADDGASWYTCASFPQQTGTTSAPHPARVFAPVGSQARFAWTIGGTATPTFTFKVTVNGNHDD